MKAHSSVFDTAQVLELVRYRRTRFQRNPREESTLDKYRSIYDRFNAHAKRFKEPREALRTFLEEFNDASTRRNVYYALKSAFRVLKWEWFDEEVDPLPAPKSAEDVQRPFYTVGEVARILNSARSFIRDYLVMRIEFLSGARRTEICRLTRANYDTRTGNLFMPGIKHTPGGSWPCDPLTKQFLDEYLESHRSDFVFPGRVHGQAIHPNTVTNIWKKYCKAAAVQYVPDGFTHGKGSHGARRGRVTDLKVRLHRDVDDITKALRWKSDQMVRTYLRTTPAEVLKGIADEDIFYKEKVNG